MTARLLGLVLAGGRSSRMQRDKAALRYGPQPQLESACALLSARTGGCFVSVRADQRADSLRAAWPQIVDAPGIEGPVAGILAAQSARPDAAWLVLACDLPLLDAATLDELVAARDPTRLATAFRSVHDGLPEPLCAVWEPASAAALRRFVDDGGHCPRKFLGRHDAKLLDASNPRALDNANTPEEHAAARRALAAGGG